MSSSIVGYTYKADIYCPEHIYNEVQKHLGPIAIMSTQALPAPVLSEALLNYLAKKAGINRADEYSFDSDDFPKEILSFQDYKGSRCGVCNKLI